jgi:hypothetical protein
MLFQELTPIWEPMFSEHSQLRDGWARYVRGWWGYFQLAEARKPVFRLEQSVARATSPAPSL